jgi:hypothetical protein
MTGADKPPPTQGTVATGAMVFTSYVTSSSVVAMKR